MKIEISRAAFMKGYQIAAMVAPARSHVDILQNIRITASDDHAWLEATDLDVGVRVDVSDSVTSLSPGAVVVPVSRMASILRESTDDVVTVESTDKGTKVSGARSKYLLPSANPDEFPAVQPMQPSGYISVSARAFSAAISRTNYATDSLSSRFALGGIKIEPEEDGSINVVGTDGRRLSRVNIASSECEVVGESSIPDSTVVQSRAAVSIERMISGSSIDGGEVHIQATHSDIIVGVGESVIRSRLVDGRYPAWRQVIPARDDLETVVIQAGVIESAVRQAAITTDKESRGVSFEFGYGKMVLRSATAEIGDSEIETVITYSGPRFERRFDKGYVLDFCKVVPSESLVYVLADPAKMDATIFEVEGGFLNVIMPMAPEN